MADCGIQPTYEELKPFAPKADPSDNPGIQPTYEELKQDVRDAIAEVVASYPAYL